MPNQRQASGTNQQLNVNITVVIQLVDPPQKALSINRTSQLQMSVKISIDFTTILRSCISLHNHQIGYIVFSDHSCFIMHVSPYI